MELIEEIHDILNHTLMITGFVFSMMLLIEYVNVITHGEWQNKLKKKKYGQILLGVFLGIIPGCLGSFTVVSLYSHGILSFGALTATMIASSGDEAYVMFSLFPETAIYLTLFIAVIGIITGILVDKYFKNQNKLLPESVHEFEIHQNDWCDCRPRYQQIKTNFKNISFARGLLLGILTIILLSTLSKFIGTGGSHSNDDAEWVTITLAVVTLIGLFVVSVVPEHFLEEHLWRHVLKKHLLRIFLWTLGALIVVHIAQHFIDVESFIKDNYFTVLIIAVSIGLIPESGPHLIFVTLFASGTLPFGILAASSIVQDGHGTLPLIPFSRKSFIYLKIINAIAGLIIGSIFYFI